MDDGRHEQAITHERLDVYRVAVALRGLVGEVEAFDSIWDQVVRASDSVVLNIAEGVGRRTAGEKAYFFGVARGSAHEVSACFDVLLVTERVTLAQHARARTLVRRTVQMLSGLIRRRPG